MKIYFIFMLLTAVLIDKVSAADVVAKRDRTLLPYLLTPCRVRSVENSPTKVSQAQSPAAPCSRLLRVRISFSWHDGGSPEKSLRPREFSLQLSSDAMVVTSECLRALLREQCGIGETAHLNCYVDNRPLGDGYDLESLMEKMIQIDVDH